MIASTGRVLQDIAYLSVLPEGVMERERKLVEDEYLPQMEAGGWNLKVFNGYRTYGERD